MWRKADMPKIVNIWKIAAVFGAKIPECQL
jgi:hypothetical protein